MNLCSKCGKKLDDYEENYYDGFCKKCIINDIKKHVLKIEKPRIEKHRKPSNVIYVVNKPQPGQVKGDWAVRGHRKIYSYHRTKNNAIKIARSIAKKRDATVMVQKTNGTFSRGFRSKMKNKIK